MKSLLILLVVLTSFSCKQKEYTTADLSFKLIRVSSLYGADELEIQRFEEILDSIIKNPYAKKKEIEAYNYYAELKENDLFTSPYIYLQIDKDSSLLVYLNEDEYQKVKVFDSEDLLKRKRKVSMRLDIEKKDEGIYVVNKIISVHEIDGQTIVVK